MQTTTTVVLQRPPYDKGTALFGSLGLAWFAGIHGFHRCYVGETGLGLLQCLTCGGCWSWSIVDWINMERIVGAANARAGWTERVTQTTTTQAVAQVYIPQQAYPVQGSPPQQSYPVQPQPGYPVQPQGYPVQPQPGYPVQPQGYPVQPQPGYPVQPQPGYPQ